MLYQDRVSPCYSCNMPHCRICAHRIYAKTDFISSFNSKKTKDRFIENLWSECENIAFVENEDGELVLDQPWRGFPVGEFTQDDWFYWVDHYHSKGVGWVYENIS